MRLELDTQDLESIASLVAERITPLLCKQTEEDVIYNVEEVSVYLRVEKQWVYGRVHNNTIPHFKMGKYPRFRKHDIDLWLDQLRKGPKNAFGSG